MSPPLRHDEHRPWRDLRWVLPLTGVALFMPPLILIFDRPVTLFGVPLLLFYIGAVWLVGICLTALVGSRGLDEKERRDRSGGPDNSR